MCSTVRAGKTKPSRSLKTTRQVAARLNPNTTPPMKNLKMIDPGRGEGPSDPSGKNEEEIVRPFATSIIG
jgi:hypothetical protein